jgi:hypothetical protein
MKQEIVPPVPTRSNSLIKKSLFIAVATLSLVFVFAYYPNFKESAVNISGVSINTDTVETGINSKPAGFFYFAPV